jgi:hypothetical protein
MRAIRTAVLLFLPITASAQGGPLQHVRWLEGCWQLTRATSTTVERWLAPTAGVMAGDSWTLANGVERESEKLRLFARGDTLVYEATPSSQTKTEFRTTAVAGPEIVFANPEHDFPQRIVYRRVGNDSVIARIEGDRAGRRQPVTYAYARVSCASVTEAPTAIARRLLQPLYEDVNAREVVYAGATNGWYAEHAAPGFRHLTWASSGATVPVATAAVLARADSGMRANPNRVPVTNRKHKTTVEQVLVTSDTLEALVVVLQSWNFADTAGTYGPAGATHERSTIQRRLDRWVKSGMAPKLREVLVISSESSLDGKLVLKNGRLMPPTH